MKKQVLYLSSILPSTNGAGSNIEYQLLDLIKHQFSDVEIDALIIKSDKDYGNESVLKNIFNSYKVFKINTLNRIVNTLLFLYLPGMLVYRLKLSVLLKIIFLTKKYDYVYYGFSQSTVYSFLLKKKYPNAIHFLTVHDILYQAFLRKSENQKNILKKWFFKFEKMKLLFWEKKYYNIMDYVLFISKKDKKLVNLSEKKSLIIYPYYTKYSYYANINKSDTFTISYWGSFKRFENIDAVSHYLDVIHPAIQTKIPNYVFTPIGYDAVKHFSDCTNIHVISDPLDPSHFLNKSNLSFIWLRFGAGVKIKVLELLNLGIPVITNELGGEGIPETLGLFICKNVDEALDIVVKIYTGEIRLKSIDIKNDFISKFTCDNNIDVFKQIFS